MINKNRTNGKVFTNNSYYNNPIKLTIQIVEPLKVLYTRYTGAYKGNSDLFSKLFTKLYCFANKNKLISRDTKWFVLYHDHSDLTAEEKLRVSVCMSIKNDMTNIARRDSVKLVKAPVR